MSAKAKPATKSERREAERRKAKEKERQGATLASQATRARVSRGYRKNKSTGKG